MACVATDPRKVYLRTDYIRIKSSNKLSVVMDKNSNVGTQYIICECGDNFPDENLLNIHLANDHGSVEVYQCNAVSI